MMSSKIKKQLEKDLEAALDKEIEIKRAREILSDFKKSEGRGMPRAYTNIVVKNAVKILYVNAHSQTIKKEKRVTEKISKYAVKIDDNATVLSDLLNDVVFETSNILDTLSLTDMTDKVSNDGREDQDDDLLQAVLEPAARKQKKQAERHMIGLMPDTPKDEPSDDDDDPHAGGRKCTIARTMKSPAN